MALSRRWTAQPDLPSLRTRDRARHGPQRALDGAGWPPHGERRPDAPRPSAGAGRRSL